MSALNKLLENYRNTSKTEREKGNYFEELIVTYFKNEEFRIYLYTFFIISIVIFLNINYYNIYNWSLTSLRHSMFTTATLLSTTGFVTENYELWPNLSVMLIFVLFWYMSFWVQCVAEPAQEDSRGPVWARDYLCNKRTFRCFFCSKWAFWGRRNKRDLTAPSHCQRVWKVSDLNSSGLFLFSFAHSWNITFAGCQYLSL